MCQTPGRPSARVADLYSVVVSTPIMGSFVRPHGGTKTPKGRNRKNMFLWRAGLPKVQIIPLIALAYTPKGTCVYPKKDMR